MKKEKSIKINVVFEFFSISNFPHPNPIPKYAPVR